MKELSFLLSLAILIGCQPSEKPEEKKVVETKAYPIEAFYENVHVGGGNFSNDETKLLIHSDESGIYNVYEIDIATGDKTQLTFSETSANYAIGYVPNSDFFLYSADGEGDENHHIYLYKSSTEIEDLTPFDEATSQFQGFSKDDKHFYFSSNNRDKRYFDFYKMSLDTWKSEMIYENKDGRNLVDISDDERYLAFSERITRTENKLYLYDRTTKKEVEISTTPGSYSTEGFSNDNTTLYLTIDIDKEFSYLVAYDVESATITPVYESDWDVEYSYTSETEKYRVIGINKDGKTVLDITNLETGKPVSFPDVNGDISGISISKSENLMRLSIGSSKSPNDIYVYNIDTKELKRLTNSLNPNIDPNDLVEAEVVRYESFDGLEIPAIYYKPKNATVDNKVPALVWVHGGPGGQSKQGYSEGIQYLVNHGYAILAVNNRGSGGYGKSFKKMDDRNHGDKDLKDCIYGKKWLQGQDYINGEEIGILGGSYGGFMTMAAMTSTPDEFKVGVNLFGVTNWIRTLNSIPAHWESGRKALYVEMGDPNTEDSVRLKAISPLFHADKIKNPIMVLQGSNDPRVLQVESDEIVAAAKANNVAVEYVLFADEGHGFRKKENNIEAWSKIREFLDTYLAGKG